MPYISAIPGAIVLIIGICHAFNHYLYKWRPEWTRPFVPEYPPESTELSLHEGKQRLGWIISLLLVSAAGLIAEVAQLLLPGSDLTAVILTVSWVSISSRWFYERQLTSH